MYYVVTGACGFIGANLVKALNLRGDTDIIAVDNLEKADKFRNLTDCEIADYIDKREFLDLVEHGQLDGGVEAMLHQGARGYLRTAAAQRRLREAYFVAIVTPSLKHLRREIERRMKLNGATTDASPCGVEHG